MILCLIPGQLFPSFYGLAQWKGFMVFDGGSISLVSWLLDGADQCYMALAVSFWHMA